MAKVFLFTLHEFETFFTDASRRLNMQKPQCTPHGLRNRGPSHDRWTNKRDQADIMKRGRWETLLRYEVC